MLQLRKQQNFIFYEFIKVYIYFIITAMRRIWILSDSLPTKHETFILKRTLREFHIKLSYKQ